MPKNMPKVPPKKKLKQTDLRISFQQSRVGQVTVILFILSA